MKKELSQEFVFITSRSGGKGGQNVNKVSTKVELRFDVLNSKLLTQAEKELITTRLAARISGEGLLQVVSQSERTQLGNKATCVAKFYTLLAKALSPVKKRKKTKPGKAAIAKRLDAKKKLSVKKAERRFISDP